MSLAGDSQPLRLRSVAVGIAGLVTAAGLGLVAMIYQQSWPEMLAAPLPQGPDPALVHNDTIALAPAARPLAARAGRLDPGPETAPSQASPATEPRAVDRSPEAIPPPSAGVPAGPSPPPSGAGEQITSPAPAAAPTSSPRAPVVEVPPSPGVEASPPPVAPEPEDDPPGNSGHAPGHAANGHGPPPWAGSGKGNSDESVGGHGKPSWAGH